ncbi:hypothetical protein [Hymenobacter perfusus]|uniref:Uncharacterized protein n=1 Tax=Hymenobacter perfusus TaxID=1236770 RepID=A0A428JW83_9BACT|nr:hypothetical protein [Hymenobacter perfusus]RSK38423.1 hypothetical protein EI293_21635 [Hymenobacter perfusus]
MDSAVIKYANAVPESYWTAVGNIVRERPYGPGGAEIRFGTKHFAPGAKVYIINWYAGMCRRIIVVGLHRKSKRFITLALDVRLVENLRPKVCYDPAVIAKLKEHFSPKPFFYPGTIDSLTQEFAERVCAAIPQWQQNYKNAEWVALVPDTAFESRVAWRQRLLDFFGFLLKRSFQ